MSLKPKKTETSCIKKSETRRQKSLEIYMVPYIQKEPTYMINMKQMMKLGRKSKDFCKIIKIRNSFQWFSHYVIPEKRINRLFTNINLNFKKIIRRLLLKKKYYFWLSRPLLIICSLTHSLIDSLLVSLTIYRPTKI